MSGDAPDTGGVPPSIAAIMAAIRQEVAAPAANVPAAGDEDPPAAATVPPPVRHESRDGTAPIPLRAPPLVPPPGLDAEVRALLAPMLRDWLDAHLPEIVEAAVHAELRRLTGIV